MRQRRHELRNVAASVRQRLLNLSRTEGEDFQKVLLRFAIERLLYRLSRSPHHHRFVLKGATLFALWSDSPHRSTQDLDLWSHGESSIQTLEQSFREICAMPVEDDGLVFSVDTVRGSEIRIDDEYQAVRLKFLASIASARIPIQVDIGFGDAIRPRPAPIEFPALLDFPRARLLAYQRETVVAEKFHAMTTLGMGNSRMKDFYDLFVLARDFELDGCTLTLAIQATFERRDTPIHAEPPLSLTAEFHNDSNKRMQWRSFLQKNRLEDDEIDLARVVRAIREFVLPAAAALAVDTPFNKLWKPGGPWALIGARDLELAEGDPEIDATAGAS